MEASGSIPLPPMPLKKVGESIIAAPYPPPAFRGRGTARSAVEGSWSAPKAPAKGPSTSFAGPPPLESEGRRSSLARASAGPAGPAWAADEAARPGAGVLAVAPDLGAVDEHVVDPG